MPQYPQVVFVRMDEGKDSKNPKLVAAKFQSEVGKIGEKIKVGVYRLTSMVDVAGIPAAKKVTEKTIIKKKKKTGGK